MIQYKNLVSGINIIETLHPLSIYLHENLYI
jgi:hypothetical protein